MKLKKILLLLDNEKKNKDEWIKYEKQIKLAIIGIIISTLFLAVILIFFHKQIWVIIVNIGVIAGLIGDLIAIFDRIRKRR